MRRPPALLVALACLALPGAAAARPKVVVIETDDQAVADLASMPRTRALIGDAGGEHRARSGKILPYEPSIRAPLLLRGPGIPAGVVRSQLVWNGDLAPAILAAAGARAPWEPDGQSLLPFVRDAALESGRAVVIEGPTRDGSLGRPRFTGLRTPRYVYVEYEDREVELYDLRRDPSELDNLAGTPAAAAVQARLAARLDALRACAGAACRAASHSDRT